MKSYKFVVLRTVLETCEVTVSEVNLRSDETPAGHAIAKSHMADHWERHWADYDAELLEEVVDEPK